MQYIQNLDKLKVRRAYGQRDDVLGSFVSISFSLIAQ